MYLIFEVLRLVSAVFRTAIAVQAINKSPPYGHLVLNKEKQLKIYALVGNIKNDLVKYFMQHIRNGLFIDLINT